MQDDKEAAKWYRKAAEQGHYKAQLVLGGLYIEGRGVSKNEQEGAQWVSKSAEQGHLKAQYALAQLYRDGRGVPKNAVIAYALYDVASRDGHVAATRERDALITQMSAEHIAQGKLLAAQWQKAAPIKIPTTKTLTTKPPQKAQQN